MFVYLQPTVLRVCFYCAPLAWRTGSVCVCVYCQHAFCLYVDGVEGEGVEVLGTGEINQCLAGKQPPCCPLCFSSLSLSLHRPHPQQPPSVFMSLIHLLCDDAPPAAGGCIPTKHMTAVVHQGGRHLFIEKMLWVKRCSIIAPFPILFIISLNLWEFWVAACLMCVECMHDSLNVLVAYLFLWSTPIYNRRICGKRMHKRSRKPSQTERQRCIVGEARWRAQSRAFWQKRVRMKREQTRCLICKWLSVPKTGEPFK